MWSWRIVPKQNPTRRKGVVALRETVEWEAMLDKESIRTLFLRIRALPPPKLPEEPAQEDIV
jgi:hypothetical protein